MRNYVTVHLATCGGSLIGANGTVTSPNYPASYSNDVDCEWFVEAPRGHYVEFRFTDLRTESNDNCSAADFVEIRDGNSTGPLLSRVCGSTLPNEVIATSDSFAYVRFRSNSQITNTGFKLNFVSSVEECGGVLTADTGVITSPNYPGLYAHRRTCHWTIRVPESRKITLTFEDLDIDNPFGYISSMCTGDYIQVINGDLPQSPEIGRFCVRLNAIAIPVESSGNTMTVIFRSNAGLTGRGFKASYTSDKPADCGFSFCPLTPTVIESPNFGSNASYNASTECVWVVNCASSLRSDDAASLVLRFTTLDLEHHSDCTYDFVEIREGSNHDARLLGRYCHNSNMTLPIVMTPLRSLWIRFVSDVSQAGVGFQINASISNCGGVLTNDLGYIDGPGPISGDANVDCAWILDSPYNKPIRISFLNLSLPSSNANCTDAYVEVLAGILVSAPSLGRFCRTPPPVIQTQSHQLRLNYHSAIPYSSQNSFRIQYEYQIHGCGGTIEALSGYVHSPNYPSPYDQNIECIWDLSVPNGYHIQWSFESTFDIADSSPCSNDYVQVQQVDAAGQVLPGAAAVCGNTAPAAASSTSNKIRVKFRSDAVSSGAGFKLVFSAECGAVYNTSEGAIQSPGYPDNYANNLNCTYDIIGNPQLHTIIRFTPGRFAVLDHLRSALAMPLVMLEEREHLRPGLIDATSLGCTFDYIRVLAMGNWSTEPSPLKRVCGRMAPSIFSSVGGIRLNFVTDESGVDRGWHLQFKLADCGGRLTAPSGTIRSVLYPENYHDNANCTWIITVPDNKIVKIKFEKMSLEAHSRCEFDYVAIYEGPLINSSQLLGSYCGSSIPADVVSSGSTVVVNFVTDSSQTGEGFIAVYSSEYGPAQGCGGLINVPANGSAVIRSPDVNGDGDYESNLNCVWQLVVPENFIVRLLFTNFDFEAAPFACVDYVELRDGRYESDSRIGSVMCSPESPRDFNSSTNAVYVKLYTDDSVEATGFTATVTAVPSMCGGILEAGNTTQTLTHSVLRQSERCRWIINGPENGQVDINITSLNINGDLFCSRNNYLELRDQPLLDVNNIVMACGQHRLMTFTSSGRGVQINLVITAEAVANPGFSLTYKTASCDRTWTAAAGRIVSPRWPSVYPPRSNCEIRIVAPPGHKISLFFGVVDIERHDRCEYDYLAVFNGTGVSAESLVSTMCGQVTPNPIFLQSNTATLKFVTDDSVARYGYDLTYIASQEDCGGVLYDVNGTFTSPGYPASVSSTYKCHWMIDVPQRRTIYLRLSVLPTVGNDSTAVSGACETSYVAVNTIIDDSWTITFPPQTFCTSEEIPVLRMVSNKMLVVYASNATAANNVAFRASYWSTMSDHAVTFISPTGPDEDIDYVEEY